MRSPSPRRLDARKPMPRARPLEGIPILVKDNIATADAQHTTAGSLALAEARAKRDATVVALLRQAGAVILGKANLTEFANILAIDMPAGYSSLGGQVKNPYAPQLDDAGVPIVSPGGSSSGSAVAVAAGLAAAAIGTETSGSLLSPACQNGLVTVKPTVGLISRAGIIPIAHSQDTAGPMTRTVRDAAILLNVLAAADPLDPATEGMQRPAGLYELLDRTACAARASACRAIPPTRPTMSITARCRRAPPRSWQRRSRSSKRRARRSCAPTSRPRAGSAAPAPRWRSSTAIRKARPSSSRCAGRSSSFTS